MAITNKVPIPLDDKIAQAKRRQYGPKEQDPLEGKVTQPWVDYFTSVNDELNASPTRAYGVSLTEQSAAIGSTDITDGFNPTGVYRLSYFAHITTVDGVSSSLTITLDWTTGGIPLAFSGAAIASDSTSAFQTDSLLIKADGLAPVRYATTYASNTPNAMHYELVVILEAIE
jgi:hypothetical protein